MDELQAVIAEIHREAKHETGGPKGLRIAELEAHHIQSGCCTDNGLGKRGADNERLRQIFDRGEESGDWSENEVLAHMRAAMERK